MERLVHGAPHEALSMIPRELREQVIAIYGMTCHLCFGPIAPGDLSIDHVTPRALGGKDELENLRPAHKECNRIKAHLVPENSIYHRRRLKRLKRERRRQR